MFAAPHSTIAANLAVQPYDPAAYIETAKSGNRVSRRAFIYGSQNIVLGGKCIIHHAVTIRGDLRKAPAASGTDAAATAAAAASGGKTPNPVVAVSMSKYCVLGEGCTLRPPYKTYRGTFTYYPLKMGEYVSIGAGSIIEAASIGSHVEIGRGCVVGKLCSIKDSIRVLDGSVLPAGTVLPSGTVWGGAPATCLGELEENFDELHKLRMKDYYERHRPALAQ